MTGLKTDLERVRAVVGDSLDIRNYLDAADQAFRFLRTHGEALAGMVRDAERWRELEERVSPQHDGYWYVHPGAGCDRMKSARELRMNIDQAMQESRDE